MNAAPSIPAAPPEPAFLRTLPEDYQRAIRLYAEERAAYVARVFFIPLIPRRLYPVLIEQVEAYSQNIK